MTTPNSDPTASAAKPSVWTVEKIGYPDECYQLGIAATRDDALALLKDRYGPPYRVTWREEVVNGVLEVTGKFEAVIQHSTEHEATYVIAEATVYGR